MVDYKYKNKQTGEEVVAHKFEVWLVGTNPEHYCIGFVKGSAQVCQEALKKHENGTAWALSKIVLDTFTSATYISTPVPFRVDLAKSTVRQLDGELCASLPEHLIPPRSVAEVSCITTKRSTDLIAVVKDVNTDRMRKSKNDEDIVDIVLVDNSLTAGDKLATIVVSVFGSTKIPEPRGAPQPACFDQRVRERESCGGGLLSCCRSSLLSGCR